MTTPENTIRANFQPPNRGFRGALKSRDFSYLWVAQLGSEIGNGLVQLALPFLVLRITDSAFQLGFAYFFQFLPMLLFGVIGGVFADRWDRRLTMIIVDILRAGAFLSVGVIYYLGALTVEHVYAMIFLESSLANFFNPARAALMPNLVPEENLRSANSLMEVSRHVGFLIAPPVGAVVSELTGPATLFVIDGVTFAMAAVMVGLIKWRPPLREIAATAQSSWHAVQQVFQEMAEGFGVIGRERLLQVAVLLGFSLNMVVAPIQVLMPLFVEDVKNQTEAYFGLLVAGMLVGLIVGSLTTPGLSRRFGLGRMAITYVLSLGLVIAIAPWLPALWPPVIGMALAGISIGSLSVAQTTLIQGSTSDEERGRVSATYYTTTLGPRPFIFLTIGAVASATTDVRPIFTVLGLLTLAVGVFLSRMKEVRAAH